jgi:hypothetical protein
VDKPRRGAIVIAISAVCAFWRIFDRFAHIDPAILHAGAEGVDLDDVVACERIGQEMYQRSLLDDPLIEPSRALVGIVGSAPALTPTQRKFNQLIERLNLQRQELARWQAFRQIYHQQLAEHYQPALARLREKQIALVRLLDRFLDGKALAKRESAKVRGILSDLLAQLLAASPDPELVRIYEKYSDRSFSDEQQHLDVIRTLASETFGIDVEAYQGGESPEELGHWVDEQLRAGRPEPQQGPRRKKSAKAIARETQRKEAAQGGTRAVREVFRKLVSELHPDRETDPAEHARKTELMQRVNQAYKAGDLLALLELQLSIEQIDPRALAGLAEERLRHYIYVLDEQSRRLRDELAEFVAPFAMAMGKSPVRKLSPEIVQRALEADIREVQALERTLEADLIRFQDISRFRRSLRDYQIDPFEDMDLRASTEFRPPRGRRKMRRS